MDTSHPAEMLAIPPDLLAEIQAEAREEHRSADDVLRDVIKRGLAERRWQVHAGQARQQAHEAGLPAGEGDQTITDDYCQDMREKIAQGVRSLRAGSVTDGPAFMARMDAELAELERRGRK